MAVEKLVGLNFIDDAAYQLCRDEMTPILLSYGGGFDYEFKISEVLKSKTEVGRVESWRGNPIEQPLSEVVPKNRTVL